MPPQPDTSSPLSTADPRETIKSILDQAALDPDRDIDRETSRRLIAAAREARRAFLLTERAKKEKALTRGPKRTKGLNLSPEEKEILGGLFTDEGESSK